MLRLLRAKGFVKIDSFSSPESIQQPNQKENSDRVHDYRSNLKSYMHKWKDHEDLSKFGTFKIHNTRTVISLWTTRNPWNCTAPPCLKHAHSTTYHSNWCFLLNSTDSNRITSASSGSIPNPKNSWHTSRLPTHKASTPPICEETTQPRRDLFFHKQPWWISRSCWDRQVQVSSRK